MKTDTARDAAPLAALDRMTVRIGARTVLDSISMEVRTGEFWAVIGPNGAGKSTLLGLFNGMVQAESGTALFASHPVRGRDVHRARLDIAHVFQATDLDPKMPLSVFEAVLSGSYGRLGLFRRPGRREGELAGHCLDMVGLGALAGRPIGQLSGGERQRVAIARALCQQPKLMMLDEPTAALDWQAQRDILNSIAGLRSMSDMAVIMVTHDLNAVFSMATHVLMLKDGGILWKGSVDDARDGALLSGLFDVQISLAWHDGRCVALF